MYIYIYIYIYIYVWLSSPTRASWRSVCYIGFCWGDIGLHRSLLQRHSALFWKFRALLRERLVVCRRLAEGVEWVFNMCDIAYNLCRYWQDSFMCDVTRSYVWHDSFIYVTWLVHIFHMTRSCVWHDSLIRVTHSYVGHSFFHTCDRTHWYVWPDSLMCAFTHSYVCHDSFVCVTCLIHLCDMTLSYVWQNSFACVKRPIHTCDMEHYKCDTNHL